jgi:hypothetical protein
MTCRMGGMTRSWPAHTPGHGPARQHHCYCVARWWSKVVLVGHGGGGTTVLPGGGGGGVELGVGAIGGGGGVGICCPNRRDKRRERESTVAIGQAPFLLKSLGSIYMGGGEVHFYPWRCYYITRSLIGPLLYKDGGFLAHSTYGDPPTGGGDHLRL